MQTKRCSKCGIIKSVSEFYRNKREKDGLQTHCKACVKAYRQVNKVKIAAWHKQYYEEHRAEFAVYRQEHKTEIAAKKKLYRQEHKVEIAAKKKAYWQNNKVEIAVWNKAYRQNNKAEIATRQKAYRQTAAGKDANKKGSHKRRALKLNATVEDFSPAEVFERDNYICQYCGKKTRPDYNCNHPLFPNLDHIIPLSKNGEHSKRNTQCLCRRCNNIKHNNQLNDQLRAFG